MASRDGRARAAVGPSPAAPPQPGTAPAGPAAGTLAAPAAPASLARRYWPAPAAAAVMLVLLLWGLGRHSSMGNDEVATRWAASLSLGQLAHLLRNIDAVHGTYYLLMHFWMLIGSSPTALRIPSVIAMAAAVALVTIIGRQLTGSGWAGLFAGLVTAFTPALSYYGQTARSYTLVFACVTASTLVLIQALRSETAAPATGVAATGVPAAGVAAAGVAAAGVPAAGVAATGVPAAGVAAAGVAATGVPGPGSLLGPGSRARSWWLAYGALIMVSGYLNELALLVLTAHAVTVLIVRPGWPAIRRWAVAAAAGAILVAPVVIVSSREAGAVTWIARPNAGTLLVQYHDYFGTRPLVSAALIICMIIALLPPLRRGGGWPAWWRGGLSVPSVAAPLLIMPAALLISESLVARPFYVDRYVLYGEAGAALLAGAGLYRIGQWVSTGLRWRPLVAVPGVIVLVGVLLLQLGAQRFDRTPASREFDFGSPSRYVGAHARAGDGVLYLGAFFRKASLGYPHDFRNVTDFGVAITPRASGTFQGINEPFSELRPVMLRYQRIWVVGGVPRAELPRGLMRSESMELLQNFTPLTVPAAGQALPRARAPAPWAGACPGCGRLPWVRAPGRYGSPCGAWRVTAICLAPPAS
jgi:mannosyltransferase